MGEWFGPSTAAGTIKYLVNEYEGAGLGVVSGGDGVVYQSEVETIGRWKEGEKTRPVLVLLGARLGIDEVNPVYWPSIKVRHLFFLSRTNTELTTRRKALFTFPQSVGIAGGRPSSSYYFIGTQENSLFYIDPHYPRPSISLRIPSVSDPLYNLALALPLSATKENRDLNDFFSIAYSEDELTTYHSDTVRRMALRNLDPSMLLGFLIRDHSDWQDFENRVGDVSCRISHRSKRRRETTLKRR